MHWRDIRLAALLAAGALALAGCGSDGGSGSAKGGNGTDRAFVAAMVPHHRSAVEMATVAQKKGKSPFVKKLAGDIIWTQKTEIATMGREDEGLDLAGVKPGRLDVPEHQMGMDDDPAMLRDARPFDRAFIDMMIPHHQGAIRMARVEMDKGSDPELKRLAGDIIDAQTREIEEMNAHRKRAFGSTSPAGGVPAGGADHSMGQSG
ncbi:MAG: DUF305 domain-containing protein [Solirubrobacteraceae bacterium]